jgi:hypothetical protein
VRVGGEGAVVVHQQHLAPGWWREEATSASRAGGLLVMTLTTVLGQSSDESLATGHLCSVESPSLWNASTTLALGRSAG